MLTVAPTPAAPFPAFDPYSAAMFRAQGMVRRQAVRLGRERARAPLQLAELLPLPAGRRLLLVRNCARLRTWALGELLAQRSLEIGAEDTSEARSLAELAVEIAEHPEGREWSEAMTRDLAAMAWACLADAHRAAGETDRAGELLARAEARLAEGSGDWLLATRLTEIRAAVDRDRGRFAEADRAFEELADLHEHMGELHLAGRATVSRGEVLRRAGNGERALWLLLRGLRWLDAAREPRLVAETRENVARVLRGLGCHRKARSWAP